MALSIKLSKVDNDTKSKIIEKCCVKPKTTQYNSDPDTVVCFSTNTKEDLIYVPLGIWRDIYKTFPQRIYPKSCMKSTKQMYTKKTDPKGYRDQDVVVKDALDKLKVDHTVFIAGATGFGKSSVGAYISCELGLKTVVLCHIDEVNKQWVEEYQTFTTAKVQRVQGNVSLDPKADVYVIGVLKASKMSRDDLKDIGTVIFDEAHIATITAFKTALLRFQPRYVIGLSATPRRADGMHKLINMYFGPKDKFIVREEVKNFNVYKVQTPYKPKITYSFINGRTTLNWTELINSLAYNSKRQDYIVDLIFKHPDHRIMVLSDRVDECKAIATKLEAKEKSVLLLIGGTNTKGIDKSSFRVLVAGMKKAGVGFNDPTLTMLIIATDKMDIAQMEGRIRTSDNIIYDLVDDYSTLETHWGQREKWYLHRGATVSIINLRTPEVPVQRLLGKLKK